jgi:hypothetical protein
VEYPVGSIGDGMVLIFFLIVNLLAHLLAIRSVSSLAFLVVGMGILATMFSCMRMGEDCGNNLLVLA